MNAAPFAARRARLLAQLEPGSVAVLATSLEVARNADSDYPYRHDSSFYYLTGFTEPEAVLVLVAARGTQAAQAMLFCREKNPERETWDGLRYGPEAARDTFGFDAAYPIGALDAHMATLLADVPAVYCKLARDEQLDQRLRRWLDSVRRQGRSGIQAPPALRDVNPLVDEMRVVKDAFEQAIMLRAGEISGAAHVRAMRAARPGVFEYALEAELLYEFRRNGAQFPAYTPIVASGANSCILHYNSNDRRIDDGDLVLIDAGCELDGYASDITRTFPVNGRFSGPQRTLYELVLAAQQAAFDAVQPGRTFHSVHQAALRVLAQGMLDLKLLRRDTHGSVDDVIAAKAYLPFYMHGTSHWLGMDVHDAGAYRLPTGSEAPGQEKPSRPLQEGMVLTIEPGIYVRPAEGVPEQFWNIGIRIEDDVVVAPGGHTLLTGSAPKTVADIEALMKGAA
ncbi:aminopeptidase P N-terminal domain-containing protein [Pseudoduganella chitinolytica]|uniref:Xaa-Pro aminopeptidase n=1 Tax=Pseudoduganella chitinolytica TaxID=34070 RepID=A0ABY8B9G6_9BURK|nr:aminopeptidase P N-terminal domain-containing protein [Pseudoduganella chitinolytica]WEF31641.1 aminopeptidase P N-terminal domain-containing protein [Pseudoduganella chitinolytica]